MVTPVGLATLRLALGLRVTRDIGSTIYKRGFSVLCRRTNGKTDTTATGDRFGGAVLGPWSVLPSVVTAVLVTAVLSGAVPVGGAGRRVSSHHEP